MYIAHITMTSKSYHPSNHWTIFHEDKVTAATLLELKAKLSEHYGKSWAYKRPMYRDKKDGSTVRGGWIVGFRVDEGGKGGKYLEQDWISLSECTLIEWKA